MVLGGLYAVDGKVFADAEDAKIMARIAELELAEAAAEDDGTGSDDDNDAEVYRPFTPFQRSMLDEDEDEDEDEEGEDEEEEEEDDDEYEDALQRLAQLPSSSSEKRAHVTTELYQPQPNRVPSEEHHVRGAHEIHAAAHRVRFKDELNVERGASLSAQDPLPPHSHSPSTVHLQVCVCVSKIFTQSCGLFIICGNWFQSFGIRSCGLWIKVLFCFKLVLKMTAVQSLGQDSRIELEDMGL
jgi:hypothetical protein